jgi:hypothetical protein
MEKSGQLHAPAALCLGPWNPLDEADAGGPQSQSERCGERENLLTLPGMEAKFFAFRSRLLCFLLGLFFDPEDRDNMLLRNVGRRHFPEDRTLPSSHLLEDRQACLPQCVLTLSKPNHRVSCFFSLKT